MIVPDWTLFPLDCREAMRLCMAPDSIDAIVTDPPYHLTSIVKRFGSDDAAPAQFGNDGAFKRLSTGFMGSRWDGLSAPPIEPGLGHWLAGFTDGEGCFVTRKNGAGYMCEFVIHIRADDLPILQHVSRQLGIGKVSGPTVRADGGNPMAKWVVSRQLDCMKLVCFFREFPLRAKKKRDFELWADAVALWVDHEPGESWSELKSYSEALSAIKLFGANFDAAQFFHFQWAKEAYRVLKPGGFLLSFGGTRTYHRLVAGIEDAGFEIRDQVAWVFGSGFPKSLNVGDGRGTALKPAHEPIVLARKPLSEKSVAANVLRWGTGAINIDGCRIAGPESTRRPTGKPLNGGAYGSDRSDRMTTDRIGGSDVGRFPANFMHDGSPEVLAAFPTAPGQLARASESDTPRNGQHIYGAMTRGSEPPEPRGDSGSAARFFYTAKASKADREEGLSALPLRAAGMVSDHSGAHITRREEGYEPPQRANNHPTVKPTALMRYLIRLITPPGGTVFDPFTGSGSTGKAAMLEGFSFVGCEMTAEYIPIAEARIVHALAAYQAIDPAVTPGYGEKL